MSTTAELSRTPFHDYHVKHGANMVPYAGWEMPLLYSSIIEEHKQVRNSGGLFDVSHMGQAHYIGDEAALEKLITADLAALAPGEQKYTLLLNDQGGIMDDLMVSRPFGDDMPPRDGLVQSARGICAICARYGALALGVSLRGVFAWRNLRG